MNISDLSWDSSAFAFQYPRLVQIKVPADGSCFFHALLLAFYKPYRNRMESGVPVSRESIVKDFRYDLSVRLGEYVSIDDDTTPIVYDTLSRGKLGEFAKTVPEYSLKNMQEELNSNSPVDNVYNEFISNELKKDIYILDNEKHDVYVTGNDLELLYKHHVFHYLVYRYLFSAH